MPVYIGNTNTQSRVDSRSFNREGISIRHIVTAGLTLHLDALDSDSYSGSGSTWYDLSGNGNHFTMQGNITWSSTDGFGNFSGNSTGTGNKFYCTNSSFAKAYKASNGGNGYTTFAWAKVTSTGGWLKLMGHSDSDSYIDLYGQSTTTNYHQEDGSSLYINGVSVSNDTYTLNGAGYKMLASSNYNSGSTTTPTYTFTIGNDPNSASTQASYPWLGNIVSVMVYNRVLSYNEIQQNFIMTKHRFGL
jgi:hypothetical protein